jgi:hypothetical protein
VGFERRYRISHRVNSGANLQAVYQVTHDSRAAQFTAMRRMVMRKR